MSQSAQCQVVEKFSVLCSRFSVGVFDFESLNPEPGSETGNGVEDTSHLPFAQSQRRFDCFADAGLRSLVERHAILHDEHAAANGAL